MLIKQISVFIENKRGRLAEVTSFLSDAQINIHALSIADTTDFGILRLIVSDPGTAKEVLKKDGLIVTTTDVIAVPLEHTPGSLAKILKELESLNISIEYMYAFTSRSKDYDAIVIFRLNDQEETITKLNGSNIKMLPPELLGSLNEI